MAPSPLIPPALRAQLRDLSLHVPHAGTEGVGLNASRLRGTGLEFAQYRAYERGDEPRRIDWKLHARTDRYFVREAERDSPATVWIVLDATASMLSAEPDALSKLQAGKILAACLMELALHQGDRFGLLALRDSQPILIPARHGAGQRDHCHHTLQQLDAAGPAPSLPALRPLWEQLQPPCLVILISDFFDELWAEIATKLTLARRDVMAIQLLTSLERDFPFRGGHCFVDPETQAERRVHAPRVREGYLKNFATAQATLKQRLGAVDLQHVTHVLDQPLLHALQALLNPAIRRTR